MNRSILSARRLLGVALAVGLVTSVLAANDPVDQPRDFSAGNAFDVVVADGHVHLLFAQPGHGDGRANLNLFHTRSGDGGATWSLPIRIPTDHASPGRHQRGHDPRLAVSGDHLMVLWTAQGKGPWGSGPLATARSNDGGETWTAGPGVGGRPDEGFRFPAVNANGDGFHAVWIHADGDSRSLRHASLPLAGGRWSVSSTIDPHICACCWNNLQFMPDGNLMVLYRDQDPSDMGVAIANDPRGTDWRLLGHAGDFGWDFPGCPHVGAGLAFGNDANGNDVLLATVWTGHPDHAGAYILRSLDGGENWRRTPMPGKPFAGPCNTDIAFLSGERAAVVWDSPEENGNRIIKVAISEDAGQSWNHLRQLSPETEYASHPRVVPLDGRVLVFWTESPTDGPARLQMRNVTP